MCVSVSCVCVCVGGGGGCVHVCVRVHVCVQGDLLVLLRSLHLHVHVAPVVRLRGAFLWQKQLHVPHTQTVRQTCGMAKLNEFEN